MMPGVISLFSVLLGIFSALAVHYRIFILFLIFAFAELLIISFQKRKFFKIFAVSVFALAFATSYIQIRPIFKPLIPQGYSGKNVSIFARTKDFSKQTSKPNTFQIDHIILNGKEFSGVGKVYFLSEPPPPYSIVQIEGKLREYDVKSFTDRLNRVVYVIYADNVKVKKSYWIFRKLAYIRNSIKENTYLSMKSKEAFLFLSSVCGISAMSYDEKTPFMNTGTAHIFAVSGLHVGILGKSSEVLLSSLGESAPIISLFILLIFVFLVGFRVSALRAFIMYAVSIIAKVSGREQIPINTLSVTALLILLFNPLAIFSVSFQLSFAAIFALIILSPLFYKRMPEGFLYKSISEVISVQLVIFPIIAFYFHTLSLISFLANLIVIPLMYLLMPVGIIQMILSMSGLTPARLFSGVTNLFFGTLDKAVLFFSKIPYSSVNVSFNAYLLFLYFALLALFLFVFYKNKKWKYAVLLGAFAIFTLPFLFKPSFAVYPLSLKGEDGFLVCYENSAIYITSPTDLKSEDVDFYAIQNAFKNHGINKIDLMLFDSPFKDRESSSAKLISTIPVKYVVLLKGNSDLENAFFDVNKEKTDIHIVGHDAQINFRGVKIRLIGENAVMLTANGKKYLFIGRRTHSLDSVLYADVVYARSGTKITGNMEFGKLYSY